MLKFLYIYLSSSMLLFIYMKKALLLILLFSINTFAQNYVLDDSFGTNGTVIHNEVSYYPTDVLLVDNSYYFISDNNMVKLNYDGTIAPGFGTNGIITLDNNSYNFTIAGFKYLNNYFYVFGTMQDREEGRENGFICKIDGNGNFDTTFGTNNFAIADFNAQEIINDFAVDQSGNLFCVGTRYDGEVNNSIRLIYFKISASGQLDTSFDANGFKEIAMNNYSNGRHIKNYSSNFMLIGTDTYFEPVTNTRHQRLLTCMVDGIGNPVTSYGTNGSRLTELYTGMTITLKNAELENNSLYLNYFYSASVLNQGSRLVKYELDTDVLTFNTDTYYNANFKLTGNGIFVTGADACPNVADSSCPRDFNLSRLTDEGQPDITFNSNTEYTFNFPGEIYSDDVSQALAVEPGGTILVGGHSTGIYWDTLYPSGFALLRLKPAAMGLSAIKQNKNIVYPNPFTNTVTITSDNAITSVDIFDLAGRRIGKPAFYTNNGITNVNMETVSQRGSYILKAIDADGIIFNKIIVKE